MGVTSDLVVAGRISVKLYLAGNVNVESPRVLLQVILMDGARSKREPLGVASWDGSFTKMSNVSNRKGGKESRPGSNFVTNCFKVSFKNVIQYGLHSL